LPTSFGAYPSRYRCGASSALAAATAPSGSTSSPGESWLTGNLDDYRTEKLITVDITPTPTA
jgi:hypothetical protein